MCMHSFSVRQILVDYKVLPWICNVKFAVKWKLTPLLLYVAH
jgi:hypothetical protein